MTIKEILIQYSKELENISDTPRLDVEMLLKKALGDVDSMYIRMYLDKQLTEEQEKYFLEMIKERLNENLEMEGVVFTMYDARTNLSLQVVENVKDNLDQTIYKTIIPRNIRLAEAPSHGLPINLYDPRSTGAESYMLLADEVIHKGEE